LVLSHCCPSVSLGQSYFATYHSSFRDKLSRKFTSSSSSVLCKGNQPVSSSSAQPASSAASSQGWTTNPANNNNNASLETVVDVNEDWETVRRGRQNSGSHSDSASASHKSDKRIVRFLSPLSRVLDAAVGGEPLLQRLKRPFYAKNQPFVSLLRIFKRTC
jgi:hypothetical protein